jgi:hypothetical protein
VSSAHALTSSSTRPYWRSGLRSAGKRASHSPIARLASAPAPSPPMKFESTSTKVRSVDPNRSTPIRSQATW